MKVKEFLSFFNIKSDDERIIKEVVTSTRDIVDDCVILCVKGVNVHPYHLLDKSLKRKCLAIINDYQICDGFYVEDLNKLLFSALYYFYLNNKNEVKLIGVTGTEGKSSLSDILYQGLTYNHHKALLLSTSARHKDIFLTSLTTPSAKEIINAIVYASINKYEYLILEVSSIAIDQHRIDPKYFDYIFLTNLEIDHLDYHQNIFQYHYCKISLLKNNKKGIKFVFDSVVNKYPNLFSNISNLKIINHDYQIKNTSLKRQIFTYRNKQYLTSLLFKENILNLILLMEFLYECKIYNFYLTVSNIKQIKGRNEVVNFRPYIIIDYAHSIKAFENIFINVSKFKQNKIISVFGAGGNRDKSKRKVYGEIALKYSDEIILCNDNPRHENPINIINQIRNNNDKFIVEMDRFKAIDRAIKMANKDDIILILGKGEEDYILINDHKIPFSDYLAIKRSLSK